MRGALAFARLRGLPYAHQIQLLGRTTMLIVNPSFGQEAPGKETLAGKAVDWSKDPIILFSNSKPNAKELLEGVREQMGAYRATDNIDYAHKDSPAQPAPEGMYDELASKYRAAILAIAD
jgi:thioredoxin reductase (NADPH)